MNIDGKELLKEIRATTKNWISLKVACDYLNEHYFVIDLNTFEPITDINMYQEITGKECATHKHNCPYIRLDDPFAGGCICCLCDAINRRDDLIISKKED